jgi:hypothetical protein
MATLKNLIITGTSGATVASGTGPQRPTAVTGMIRFNNVSKFFEGYDGTNWVIINATSTSTPVYYTSTPGPGVWPVPTGTTLVNALIVAGGGGGGICMGGGGGGGGVRFVTNIPVTPGGSVPVGVGAGGAGGTGRGGTGSRGGNSNFGPYTSTGGGGGANWDGGPGQPGGSGGGGVGPGPVAGTGNSPAVTPPQGWPGGVAAGGIGSYPAGGGGGGAGGQGNRGNPYRPGDGGAGVTFSTLGSGTYGGGGGGGVDGPGLFGGLGQGGGAQEPTYPNKKQNQDTQGRQDVGMEAQNAYMTSLFDPGAYTKAKVVILGDPDYLVQETPASINQVYNQFYEL